MPFRLRFLLRSSRLFSFWISESATGESGGYLAAGGPRYDSYRDDPTTSTGVGTDTVPKGFKLLRNSPNPFGSEGTRIQFRLTVPNQIELALFDTLGRKVSTLDAGQRAAGLHEVRLGGAHLLSGVYFCRLTVDGRTDALKIVRR